MHKGFEHNPKSFLLRLFAEPFKNKRSSSRETHEAKSDASDAKHTAHVVLAVIVTPDETYIVLSLNNKAEQLRPPVSTSWHQSD